MVRRNRFRLSWLVLPAMCLCAAQPLRAQPGADPLIEEPVSTETAFDRYVVAGGWVTIGLLIPISVTALALGVLGVLSTNRTAMLSPEMLADLHAALDRGDYAEAVRICSVDRSLLGQVLYRGFRRAAEGPNEVRRAMQMATDEQAAGILRRLEYLNLIGHVAPMVGLFGTVHGIIGMFGSIADAGGVPIMARISGDLSTALVATFWGLLIAIPALTGFGLLRARLDRHLRDCALSAEGVLAALRKGGNGESATPVRAPAQVATAPI